MRDRIIPRNFSRMVLCQNSSMVRLYVPNPVGKNTSVSDPSRHGLPARRICYQPLCETILWCDRPWRQRLFDKGLGSCQAVRASCLLRLSFFHCEKRPAIRSRRQQPALGINWRVCLRQAKRFFAASQGGPGTWSAC